MNITEQNKTNIFPLMAALYLPVSGGFDFVFIEYIQRYVDSITLVCLRLIVIAFAFHLAHRLLRGHFRIQKQDMLRFLIAGGLGTGAYYIFEAIGIAMTSAALSSIILSMVPFFSLLGDWLLYGSEITGIKMLGAAGSVVGVIIIVFGAGGGELSGTLLGIILLFVAAAFWATFIVIAKPLNQKYSSLTVTTGMFTAGALVDLPVFLLYHPENLLLLSGRNFFLIVMFALLCIALADLLYMYGVGRLSIAVSSIIMNLLPLTTILISWLLFGETLTLLQLFGGAIIIAAVIITTLDKPKV